MGLEQRLRDQNQAQQQQHQQLLEKVLEVQQQAQQQHEMQQQAQQQQLAMMSVLERLDKSSSDRLLAEPSSAWRSSRLAPVVTSRRGGDEEGDKGYDAKTAYQQSLEKQRLLLNRLKNGIT